MQALVILKSANLLKSIDKSKKMEIASGIHKLNVSMANSPLANLNCYLIEGKTGWTMIDTGFFVPESFDSLRAGLDDLGITFTDIANILVTHIHPDHFGLAGRIKHLSPHTLLLMHRFEAGLIESRYVKFFDLQTKIGVMLERHGVPSFDVSIFKSASMPTLEFVQITFPDQTFFGGEIVSTGIYDLEIIWTPGHAIGHICIYEPKNRLLFSGDHILPIITPNISYHVESGDNPLDDYLHALHKIQNLPVATVLPAHEHIFTDLRGRIYEITEHHGTRKAEILKILEKNTCNAYDISGQLTWNISDSDWESLPALHKRSAVMETIAHLESMRWEHLVERIIEDDLIFYRLQG